MTKYKFTLDQSAVATARELSKQLDEAPQEGGCPFMTSTSAKPAESASGKAQSGPCPFSSSAAATAQLQTAHTASSNQASACPFSAAQADVTPDADTPPDAAMPYVRNYDSSPDQSPSPHLSALDPPLAAATCPFNYENKENMPLQCLSQSAGASGASAELDTALDEPMTEDALKEYEQAFSMDADDAMLQAYAALLSDKVAQADTEANDTPPAAAAAAAGQGSHEGHGCAKMSRMHTEAANPDAQVLHGSQAQADGGNPTADDSQHDAGQSTSHHGAADAHANFSGRSSGTSHAQLDGLNGKSAQSETDAKPESSGLGQAPQATDGFVAQTQSRVAVLSSMWHELLQQPPRWHATMLACFGVQLAMTLYFSLVHQRYVCAQPLHHWRIVCSSPVKLFATI